MGTLGGLCHRELSERKITYMIMSSYLPLSNMQEAEDAKFQHLEDMSVKHVESDSIPGGSLFPMIKEDDHV